MLLTEGLGTSSVLKGNSTTFVHLRQYEFQIGLQLTASDLCKKTMKAVHN